MQHTTQRVPASDYGLVPPLHEPTYSRSNSKGASDLDKDSSIGDVRVGVRSSQEDLVGDGDKAALVVQHVAQHKLLPLHRLLSDRIPVEIFEQIANHTGSDGTQTILSMAAVCHAWYPFCQQVLYRGVALRTWDGCLKLTALAHKPLESNVRKRLKEYTRSLLVGDPRSSVTLEARCRLSSFPLVLAGLVPLLEKLHLCNLHPPFHPNFFRSLSKLGTVTDLTLSNIRVINIHELRRIICAFPHLLTLRIERVNYPPLASPAQWASRRIPEISAPCQARLRTLSLDWSSNYHLFVCLLRWLTDASVCAELTSFEVVSPLIPLEGRFMIYDYLDLLMESIGPSVIQLVAAPEAQGQGLLWLNRSGSLRHCPNLRTLTFKLSETLWKAPVEELLSILTSMCSPYMEEIVIVIPPPHHEDYPAKGGDVEDSSLTQLHECQRRPIFATLRVVEWRARASVDAEAIRSVQRLLAPWDIRGILRIT